MYWVIILVNLLRGASIRYLTQMIEKWNLLEELTFRAVLNFYMLYQSSQPGT